jgi:hypothetical protein
MIVVALPSASTSIRKAPGLRSVNARFGVSTSNAWLASRRLTRTFIAPCVSWSCTIRSSRLRTDIPVPASRRTSAPPTWISARAPVSAHTRSPVVSGRLIDASTQSDSPAGEKLTAPLM